MQAHYDHICSLIAGLLLCGARNDWQASISVAVRSRYTRLPQTAVQQRNHTVTSLTCHLLKRVAAENCSYISHVAHIFSTFHPMMIVYCGMLFAICLLLFVWQLWNVCFNGGVAVCASCSSTVLMCVKANHGEDNAISVVPASVPVHSYVLSDNHYFHQSPYLQLWLMLVGFSLCDP